MIYITFYINTLLNNLCEAISREDESYYSKQITNTTNLNGVRVNHDLIARLNARKSEEVNDNTVLNTNLTIFKIQELREEKNRLIINNKILELKEFNYIMKILNINM